VSYHNDLLSLNRDIINKTPNLVVLSSNFKFNPPYNIEHLWHVKSTIKFIDELYHKAAIILKDGKVELIQDICSSILLGSHYWTYNESRYKIGKLIILSTLANNFIDFERYLQDSKPTHGDPN
jgi:hypothetical protein